MQIETQILNEIEQIENTLDAFRDLEPSRSISASRAALLKVRAELIADLDAALNTTEGE